jgi:hypothetical protein
MVGRLRKLLDVSMGVFRAATGGGALPPAPTPKVKNKQVSFPSYLTNTKPSETALPVPDRRTATLDLTTYRAGASTRQVMRDFIAVNPDLAAAAFAYARVAISDTYTIVARNTDGTFNRDATALAQEICSRIDILGNYDDGFSGVGSIRSTSESLIKELCTYGAMSGELVLDKARLPRGIVPISVATLEFLPDTKIKGLRPRQTIGGEKIDLDQPTFLYCALDQVLLEAYSASPFEPAIQPSLFSLEFMNDLRRIVKRAIHPRLNFKIDEDKFRKWLPPEISSSQEKLTEHMNTVISQIDDIVAGLNPEDALVFFDTIGVEYLNNGNQSLDAEYNALNGIMDAKVATGAKTLPSILGHGSGSQNIASSETLMFMKNAAGMQGKLNEFYSRAFTLAVRLFGQDVVVEFKYAPIDLRPDTELEAFKAMKQSRLLELLSLGFLEDDDASVQLTGKVTPSGFKPLSGTGFFTPPPAAAGGGNPNSNSSGPQDRRTSTPEKKKGPAKKAELDAEAG